jgi:hypothetical protein
MIGAVECCGWPLHTSRVMAETAQERFAVALELAELAEEMLRSRLRRKHPAYGEADVEREVDAWYAHRPGAEHGDAEGRAVDLERFR